MHASRRLLPIVAALGLALPVAARPQPGPATTPTAVAPDTAAARATTARGAFAPRPRGTRTIVLVRHGLYDEADPADPEVGRHLTAQGREQARYTASRLAHFELPIDVLRTSTMTRARETAAIIADSLPGHTPIPSRDLCECTPPSERASIEAEHTPAELDSCREQLDRAYAAIFRASPDRDTTEVVVCHGNVTRYFVCRVLGLDPRNWLRFGIQNCSLTILRVRADGTTSLLSYGDFGHLPPLLVTAMRRPAARPAPRDTTRR